MKLLHASDWHIGGALHVRKSYGEFGTFLNRLAVLIHGIANREAN